jgi:hypothetical protein
MKNQKVLGGVILFYIIGKICLLDTYFFWDSVSTLSKPSHFLFDNHFSSFIFPSNLVDDNLALNTLLALIWQLFGRSLLVTHIFFSIIGVALIYQLYKLCDFFVSNKKALPYIFLLVVSETALVTQSLLIMTDSLMLLLSLLSIRYILNNKRIALTFSLLGLSLLRARGFCLAGGIGVFYFLYLYLDKREKPLHQLKQAFLPFIPAIFIYLLFLCFKAVYGNTYYYFRNDSPWADHYHLVDLKRFTTNLLGAGRFFLDSGRCFCWIAFGILFLKYGKKRIFDSSIRLPLILWGSTLVCMLLVTIPTTNDMGARYFLLQYLLIALITGILLFRLLKENRAKISCILLIIGLWGGHFWVYPERLSRSWDTTLAHLPYYDLRKDMIHYLDENNIPLKNVRSFFPAAHSGRYIELNDDDRTFAASEEEADYILYSNIANWSDDWIDKTTTNGILIAEFKKGAVFIRLYKKPV